VVRLDAAGGDERVSAMRHGIGAHEAHLANLVPPKCKRQCIVSLDEETGPATERTAESRHILDWRDVRRER
jgi:hypothetical protein